MAAIPSTKLKRDAVRNAQTSGLTRRQAGLDSRLGLSTLNQGVTRVCAGASPPDPNHNVMRKKKWHRGENRIRKDLSGTGKQSGGQLSRRTPWPPMDARSCGLMALRIGAVEPEMTDRNRTGIRRPAKDFRCKKGLHFLV